MGKGNRTQVDQQDRQLAAQQKKQAQQAAKSKALRKKIIGIVATVLVVALLGSVIAYNNMLSGGFFMRRTMAASTQNYEMDQTHASYFFYQNYSQYSSAAAYLGIDTSKSLKQQTNTMTGSGTWFDYFMSMAKSNMRDILILVEEAKARGITLDKEDYDLIDANIKALRKAAREAGVSKTYYIRAMYGAGVNESDVRDVLELSSLYNKCYNAIIDSYSYTQEDYDKYVSENKNALKLFDYASMTMTTSDAAIADNVTKDTLTAFAKRFEGAKDKAAFDEIARDYLRNYAYKDDAQMTDEMITETIGGYTVENASYSEGNEFSEWAFESGRKVGQVYTVTAEEGNSLTAYILLSTPALDEAQTVNVRHILLTPDKYGSEEKAQKKADELLAKWQSGAATAESFGDLAKEYSEDTSAEKGGLIENVAPDQMVAEFNDWLFAEGRKIGDSGIVKTEYGYHLMYLDSEGMLAWQASADNALKSAQYDEDYILISAKYPITYNDAALNGING